ncbi:Uncharacterised protein [Mesomycoplasma dispar]|uniref:Uncharacterized protein n=1 Tax=Mesomycoplasma dispar TaxID=86660 RepID=A0AAJ5TC32_9BACT|nr:hypothetical protein [Mesomycoplasma dispar]AJR12533.1 hypothetical protein MDIS_01525 [Mesomycoplasma dispar]VEU61507.1 Uncharacterised protein [Mesomycoplasma dispar]
MENSELETLNNLAKFRALDFHIFYGIFIIIFLAINAYSKYKFEINLYLRKVFKFVLKLERKQKISTNQIYFSGYQKAKEIIFKNKTKIKILIVIFTFLFLLKILFFVLYKVAFNPKTVFFGIYPEISFILIFQTIFFPLYIYFRFGINKKLVSKFEEKIKNFEFISGNDYFFDDDYTNFELPELKKMRKNGNLHSEYNSFPLNFSILKNLTDFYELKNNELTDLYYFLIWGTHFQESDSVSLSYQFLYKDFLIVVEKEKKW